jgi:hypothetical protein
LFPVPAPKSPWSPMRHEDLLFLASEEPRPHVVIVDAQMDALDSFPPVDLASGEEHGQIGRRVRGALEIMKECHSSMLHSQRHKVMHRGICRATKGDFTHEKEPRLPHGKR